MWENTLALLQEQFKLEVQRNEVPEAQFPRIWSWFTAVKVLSYFEGILTLGVPSNQFRKIFEKDYLPRLLPFIASVYGPGTKVELMLSEEPAGQSGVAKTLPNSPKSTAGKTEVKQERLDPHLNSDYTFKTFVKGLSNKAALNVAKAIAKHPEQQTFNPIFLYGPSGVGKTHLVSAIGHEIYDNFPEKRVLFVSANLFKTQYQDAFLHNTINDFMHFYQSIDVLIVDDVHELNSAKTQRAFFHIFNHLQLNGRQIILTCDKAPVELQGIDERMLTRFKWGMVMMIERPDAVLRHDILSAKIRRDNLNFPKEVIQYIAENVTDNVRDLQGVVNSMMAYSIADDCDIDVALAERVVARVVNLARQKITFQDILKHLCKAYKVKPRDVIGKSRKADIVAVRQLVMYLVQKHTDMTQVQIGDALGHRDHATVIYAIRQVENRIAAEREYRLQVENLETSLKK